MAGPTLTLSHPYAMVSTPHRPDTAVTKAWSRAVTAAPEEFPWTPLPILEGKVPPGLRGSLYRNGPARLDRGGHRVGHWFDGDGAILAVRFNDEAAQATYRYVQTAGYQAEEAAGLPLYNGYGTIAPGNVLQRLRTQVKNVANTSVLPLADRLLALWEGGLPYKLDLDTLDTLGPEDLGELAGAETFSAHPKRHPRTDHIFNFGVVPGGNSTLQLYRCDRNGSIEKRQAVPLNGIPLIHDFVLADRYLVFCVSPVRLNALPAVLGLRTFSDAFMWQPRHGTQILVIDADSLEVIAWEAVDPAWFQWHFGKGYMTLDGDIALETVTYPDFATNRQLQEVASGQLQTPAAGQLQQLRLQPHTGKVLETTSLISQHCEFPVVQPGSDVDLAPTYVSIHRPGVDSTGELFGAIAQFDPATERLTVADAGANRYPSEPIYAADVNGTQGWILTVVYDGDHHSSEVWIYASDSLGAGPVCRLGLPSFIAHSFHGCWRPG